jgi:short-subunit dehydrogenase
MLDTRGSSIICDDQKLVLITGAGSGIGRALCIEAVQRGMAVALCGRRHDALVATAALLGPTASYLIIPADITRPEGRLRIVERIWNEYGALDILINNAGVVEYGPLEKFDDDAIVRTLQTNIEAPMALTRDLMPLLIAARPSRVVNVGSIFGDIGYPNFTCYSATKFALRGFSNALRREWKHKGIDVTYAAPRATLTDATAAFAGLIKRTNTKLDAPEQVARQIWRAVASGHDSVYAPAPHKLYVMIQRLFPRAFDWTLSRPT